MILEITQYGDPVLRKKCRKINALSDDLNQFGQDLIDTMISAQGIGLAAPQVGRDIRMAVVDVSHDPQCLSYLKVDGVDASLEDVMPLIFLNPVLEFGSVKEFATEGCLSIDGISAEVQRPTEIKATLQLLDGRQIVVETDGLLARAIQHEVDHLNGVLFVDRLSTAKKVSIRRKLKQLSI